MIESEVENTGIDHTIPGQGKQRSDKGASYAVIGMNISAEFLQNSCDRGEQQWNEKQCQFP